MASWPPHILGRRLESLFHRISPIVRCTTPGSRLGSTHLGHRRGDISHRLTAFRLRVTGLCCLLRRHIGAPGWCVTGTWGKDRMLKMTIPRRSVRKERACGFDRRWQCAIVDSASLTVLTYARVRSPAYLFITVDPVVF